MSEPKDLVESLRAIAQRVSERTGVHVSVETAKRLYRRPNDRLPVRKWGAGGRPRIVADVAELDAWCDRQWVDAPAELDANSETEAAPRRS